MNVERLEMVKEEIRGSRIFDMDIGCQCIAAVAAGFLAPASYDRGWFEIEDDARRILGLTWRQVGLLFYLDNWPVRFAEQYEFAGRATATVERIEHFIATEGGE